jgi:hypothetical protein
MLESRTVTRASERKTMKYKSLGLTVLLAAFAGSLFAQTHISATAKCGKADASQPVIEVGDQAGHMLMAMKVSCTYSKALEIAQLKATTLSIAEFLDVTGAKLQDRGYTVSMMENGDKAYARTQGTGVRKEGGAFTDEGTWTFTGGTGKLKGLKGKGTYRSAGNTDGEESQIEGEYSLPGASATPKGK